jgi:hypothetical protein
MDGRKEGRNAPLQMEARGIPKEKGLNHGLGSMASYQINVAKRFMKRKVELNTLKDGRKRRKRSK